MLVNKFFFVRKIMNQILIKNYGWKWRRLVVFGRIESSQAISWLKVEWWIQRFKEKNRQKKLLHIFHVKNKSDYIIFYNFIFPNKKWHEKIARLKTREKCIRMKKQKNFFIIFHPENLEIFHCFSCRFSFRIFFLKQKLKERWKIKELEKESFLLWMDWENWGISRKFWEFETSCFPCIFRKN